MQAKSAFPAIGHASGKVTAAATLPALVAIAALPALMPAALAAQTAARIEADPPSLVIERGETATLVVRVLDAEGRLVDEAVRIAGARRALSLSGGGVGPGAAAAPAPATPGRTETTVTALEVGDGRSSSRR